jgi:hypothetical protein
MSIFAVTFVKQNDLAEDPEHSPETRHSVEVRATTPAGAERKARAYWVDANEMSIPTDWKLESCVNEDSDE